MSRITTSGLKFAQSQFGRTYISPVGIATLQEPGLPDGVMTHCLDIWSLPAG